MFYIYQTILRPELFSEYIDYFFNINVGNIGCEVQNHINTGNTTWGHGRWWSSWMVT